LYRRWRAQTFSEIVGQEAVVATLRNAVATGKVAHAILFTGPRGTGKTSLARILAKALNCENLQPNADPCDVCASCVAIREGRALDLVEIDAASNRGINDVRELRERLNYAPTDLRRKVYILDEAHQITRDAWNALLKSLEEPPDFVTFMFASTHPQDFPPAILSRLQRFDVRRLTTAEISGKLARILDADGREADPDAIAVVARLAAGGMRDAESILDQLLSSTAGRIEADAVRDLLGLADGELVDGFLDALTTGDAATGIALLDRLEERGRDLRVFLDQLVDALREGILAGLGRGEGADGGIVAAARRLAAIDPTRLGPGGLRLRLELALLEPAAVPHRGEPVEPRTPATVPGRAPEQQPADAREPAHARQLDRAPAPAPALAPDTAPPVTRRPPATPAPVTPAQAPAAEPAPVATVHEPALPASEAVPSADPEPATAPAASGDDLTVLLHAWRDIVSDLARRPALKQLIEASRPVSIEGTVVTLGFPEEQGFLRDHAEKRKSAFEAAIAQRLGHPVGVRCVVTNLSLVPPLPADEEAAHILAEAHRIFADDRLDVPDVS
jgi:DNA polymerase-3 subunit gamma/tau